MTASRSLRRSMGSFAGFRSRHGPQALQLQLVHAVLPPGDPRRSGAALRRRAVPGVHSYVYLARATTVGSFVAAPTHVEQMYEPEVFGRTGAMTFEVEAP